MNVISKNKPDNWYDALNDVSKMLEEYGYTYFVDSGTLLGLIRDGDFISWDNDIDIGLIASCQEHKRLVSLIRARGSSILDTKYAIYFKINDVDIGINIYSNKGGAYVTKYWSVKADTLLNKMLVGIALTGAGIVNSRAYSGLAGVVKNSLFKLLGIVMTKHVSDFVLSRLWKTRESHVSADIFEHFIRYSDTRIQTKTPSKYQMYLEEKYGVDWKVPKQDYDYMIDDGTLIGD